MAAIIIRSSEPKPVAGRHTLVSTLVRITMRYAARWPSPPALYFAALDFFLAAHRALAASDRRLRRAGDIDLFLAGVDFFGAAEFAAVALCTGIISSEPSKSASRIF